MNKIFFKVVTTDNYWEGRKRNEIKPRLWWVIPAWVIGSILALSVVIGFFWWGVGGGIRTYQHHQDANACAIWGKQTDRPVRFVNYNFWSWDCLTQGFNGKWVSNKDPKYFAPNTSNFNVTVGKP